MTAENIIFVDSDTQPELKQAFEEFKEQKICGIDTETGSVATKFDKGGVALIQMSTEKNCYLFDSQILKSSEIFKTLLEEFFADPEILKLGFAFKGDIRELQ